MMLRISFERSWSLWLCLACTWVVTGCGQSPSNAPAPTTAKPTSSAAAPQGPTSETKSSATTPSEKGAVPAAGSYRIVILTNGSSPFWDACDRGAKEAGQKHGVKVDFIRNTDASEGGQIRRLEQLASQRDVLGVGISVLEEKAEGVAQQMRNLRKKGVHVITIDADGAKDAREAFVGTNNFEGGLELGKATAALRPGGGEAVCFVGYSGSQNARERISGFEKGIGAGIKRVDTLEDQVNESKARNNVTAAMQNHRELNILAGIWSYNAPAIADIVQSSKRRKDFSVVVFDAEPNAIAAMQRGLIDVMVVQNPFEMGFQGVTLLNAMIQQDQNEMKRMLKGTDVYDTGLKVVVPDDQSKIQSKYRMTLSDFKKWLAEKQLEGS